MTNITMTAARKLFTLGNNAGNGFAPAGVADLVGGAIETLKGEGYKVVLESTNTDEVDVLESPEGKLIAIGGDGSGRGAWAVAITGMRVQAGEGADHDTGRIVDVDRGMAIVAWDSLAETSCPVERLEAR